LAILLALTTDQTTPVDRLSGLLSRSAHDGLI
jgi:hypothetical protein